jgi:Xaa-Pro aminopeptidase
VLVGREVQVLVPQRPSNSRDRALNDLQALLDTLPRLTVVDAGPLLDDMRLPKSAYEMATLHAAAGMSLTADLANTATLRCAGRGSEPALPPRSPAATSPDPSPYG